jgi:hypothetical protein
VSSLFEDYPETIRIGDYEAQNLGAERLESLPQKLALGKTRIRSAATWEEESLNYAVLHLGDQSLVAGAARFTGMPSFSQIRDEIEEVFKKGDVPQTIGIIDKHFGDHRYSLWDLLRDKKREVLGELLASSMEEAEASFRQIFEHHYAIMDALKKNNVPLPRAFSTSVEFILNADFRNSMEREDLKLEDLKKTIQGFKKWDLQPDEILLSHISSLRLIKIMEELTADPENLSLLETFDALLELLQDFSLDMNLWKTQNLYFALCRQQKAVMQEKIKRGDPQAYNWMEWIKSIGRRLRVDCL